MSDQVDPPSKVNCPLERKRPYMSLVVLKSDYGTDREKEQKKPKKVKIRKSEIHVRTRVVIGKCDGFVHEASPNGDLVTKPDAARYWTRTQLLWDPKPVRTPLCQWDS